MSVRMGTLAATVLIALGGAVAGPARAAPGGCFDRQAPVTYEESRLAAVPYALVEAGGFTPLADRFGAELCRVASLPAALGVVQLHGALLWRTAVERAQGTRWMGTIERYDDRPLYWSRLIGTRDLRQWRPAFALPDTARAELVKTFD